MTNAKAMAATMGLSTIGICMLQDKANSPFSVIPLRIVQSSIEVCVSTHVALRTHVISARQMHFLANKNAELTGRSQYTA